MRLVTVSVFSLLKKNFYKGRTPRISQWSASQLTRVKCLNFRGDRHQRTEKKPNFYSKKHQNLSYEIQTRVWAALLPDQLTFRTLIGFLIIRAERGSIDWSPRSPLPWRRLIQWEGGLMGIEFLKYLLAASRVSIDRHSAENLQTNRLFNIRIELREQRENQLFDAQEINK